MPNHKTQRHRQARRVVVRALSQASTHGFVSIGDRMFPCALGRRGRRTRKREGDGATPIGQWRVRRLFVRGDKSMRPRTAVPIQGLRPRDGWCDAPGDPNYNRFVRHPYPASAERMWRDDHLYDLVLVLDHNERPRLRGGGSAIFVHLARPGYRPTEGCIALARRDLVLLLERLGRDSVITVPSR